MTDPPLARELSGLPELEAFTRPGERARALRVVAALNDNPYTWHYWFWAAVLVIGSVLTCQAVARALVLMGIPKPVPALAGIFAGIAAYTELFRALHRWGARPILRELLEGKTILD